MAEQRQNGGRPLKYTSAIEFADKIAGFGDWCIVNDNPMIIEFLYVYLDILREDVPRYELLNGLDDDGEYKEDNDYASHLKRAQELCTAKLAGNGATGKWRDAVSIFLLKQRGYTDRTEMSVDTTIKIEYPDDDLND